MEQILNHNMVLGKHKEEEEKSSWGSFLSLLVILVIVTGHLMLCFSCLKHIDTFFRGIYLHLCLRDRKGYITSLSVDQAGLKDFTGKSKVRETEQGRHGDARDHHREGKKR